MMLHTNNSYMDNSLASTTLRDNSSSIFSNSIRSGLKERAKRPVPYLDITKTSDKSGLFSSPSRKLEPIDEDEAFYDTPRTRKGLSLSKHSSGRRLALPEISTPSRRQKELKPLDSSEYDQPSIDEDLLSSQRERSIRKKRTEVKLPTISPQKSNALEKKRSNFYNEPNTEVNYTQVNSSIDPRMNYSMNNYQTPVYYPSWQSNYSAYQNYYPNNYQPFYNNFGMYPPQNQFGMYGGGGYQMSQSTFMPLEDPFRRFPMNPLGRRVILNDPNDPAFAGTLPRSFIPAPELPVFQPIVIPEQRALPKRVDTQASAEKVSKKESPSKPKETTKDTRKVTKRVEKRIGTGTKRQKLQATLWAIAYPQLMTKEGYAKGKERKKTIQLGFDQRVRDFISNCQNFIIRELQPQLDDIYKEKKAMTFKAADDKSALGTKNLSEKESTTRITQLLCPKIQALIEKLTTVTKPGSMPQEIVEFMASVSENQCIPPNGFYFDFEMKRLGFSHSGALSGVSETASKMVLCVSFLARILVYQFILMPWSEVKVISMAKKGKPYSSDIPKGETTKKNLKLIGSILIHLIEEMFAVALKADKNSQKKIPPKERIKTLPRGGLFYIYDEADHQVQKNETIGEDQLIAGIYSRMDLSVFYKNFPVQVEQLKTALASWVDNMYLLTHEEYKSNRKLHLFGKDGLM